MRQIEEELDMYDLFNEEDINVIEEPNIISFTDAKETTLDFGEEKTSNNTDNLNAQDEPIPLTKASEMFDKLGVPAYDRKNTKKNNTKKPGVSTNTKQSSNAKKENNSNNRKESEVQNTDVHDVGKTKTIIEEKEVNDIQKDNNIVEEKVISECIREKSIEVEEPDQVFIYDIPEEENNTSNIKNIVNKHIQINVSPVLSNILKKVAVFAIMITFIVGISIMFSNIKVSKERNIKSNTEPTTSNVASSNISTRFKTLDDLTLYIESNQGIILSNEKQALTKYENQTITYDEYINIINKNVDAADELNHLLKVNENVYSNQNKMDLYESLCDEMDEVLVYGIGCQNYK